MKITEKKIRQKLDNYIVVLSSLLIISGTLFILYLLLTVIKHGAYVFLFLISGLLSYWTIKELKEMAKINREIEEKKE